MDCENPYAAPSNASHVTDAVSEAAESPSQRYRLTSQQAQWLTHSRYAMRLLYIAVGFVVLLCAGQVFYVLVFLGPDSEFPVDEQVRNQTLLSNAIRGAIGIWIALSVSRLDRAIGQVLEHDAAPAAVNRELRLGRNAWISLASAFALMVFSVLAYPFLTLVAR